MVRKIFVYTREEVQKMGSQPMNNKDDKMSLSVEAEQ